MSLAARGVTVCAAARPLLSNVDLDVLPGQVTALTGPNGAGKSTLLKVLSGEVQPSSGRVLLDSTPLATMSIAQQAQRRALLGQSVEVPFDFKVEEILDMGWIGPPGNEREVALRSVASSCDLTGLLGRVYRTLSGGEQQRVQFGRVLLQVWRGPRDRGHRYVLLDEPTANLDIAHEGRLLERARRITTGGVGVLVVLHDFNLVARFADRVALLDAGRLIAVGSPDEVLTGSRLHHVYGVPVRVERHTELDRLVVLT